MADHPEPLLDRGVYLVPWLGPQGEAILLAVDSRHRHLAQLAIQVGDNPLPANDQLWDLLDSRDPLPPESSQESRQAS